jgi:hypothetical protein
MWYVYRAPGKFTGWLITMPMSTFCEAIGQGGPKARQAVRDAREGLADAQRVASQIGWDGTVVGEPHVITVPTAFGMQTGFIWKHNRLGQVFIASPVELPYMDEDVDWDARTDSEAMNRVKKFVAGIDPSTKVSPLPNRLNTTNWGRSAKGNAWRKIQGFVCTVFYARDNMYNGIMSGPNGEKTFTKKFDTEDDVVRYIDNNWPELIKQLE